MGVMSQASLAGGVESNRLAPHVRAMA